MRTHRVANIDCRTWRAAIFLKRFLPKDLRNGCLTWPPLYSPMHCVLDWPLTGRAFRSLHPRSTSAELCGRGAYVLSDCLGNVVNRIEGCNRGRFRKKYKKDGYKEMSVLQLCSFMFIGERSALGRSFFFRPSLKETGRGFFVDRLISRLVKFFAVFVRGHVKIN